MRDAPPIALGPLAGRPPWVGEFAARLWHRLFLKVAGVSAFMWVFFIAYFHVLRHPVHPVLQMPLTFVDRAVPFQGEWLGPYLSLWFYVGLAPGLMLKVRDMLVYGLWAAGLCLTGLTCFYFWPTAVPPHWVDVTQHPAYAVLQGVDAAGNACPSLHVASAMFTAIRLDALLRQIRCPLAMRVGNAAWFLAIAYSTLATKQHVALDVASGTFLGILFAVASLRQAPRPDGRPEPL